MYFVIRGADRLFEYLPWKPNLTYRDDVNFEQFRFISIYK